MKLIHLSDLHIGKRVNEFSLLEDQRYILEQILAVASQEQADGVLIAGDIYDKPVPPAEAVQVFDDFLTRLAERKIPVFAISGNHDCAERVAFGARLMSGTGVYLSPVYDGKVTGITLEDEYGEAVIWLLPFVKPALVRHVFADEEAGSYQEAVRIAVDHIAAEEEKRNVLLAHQFVTGAFRCESEEILVGGLDNVDVSVFDRFDYVALGHIHSPQQVGRETVRYCGTPLKYSFSEAEQEKSVTVVELGKKGQVGIRTVPLRPLRDMRRIRGTYLELTALSFYQDTNREAVLTDEEDVPDGLMKLRVIYPNLMKLEYDNQRTRDNREISGTCEAEQKSELELFEEFYELQNNQPFSERQREFVMQLIQKIQER